jgi:signal peptidase I
MEPLLIPDGFLFVMSDNRSRSQDSRVFGPIPDSLLVGKVIEIVNP